VQAGFGPLVEGFVRVPLNDCGASRGRATNQNVVAVFLEVIQGEGGIRPATIEYLQQVRRICDASGWLLMLDEVQCGMGRTGKWFAHQWAGIKPDVMPLAKGLGSGVPVGRDRVRAEGGARVRPGQPRHDVRRQPARDARRRRDDPHHGRRRLLANAAASAPR
jgi:acetylornithine/succinyldiaminopimelate/putrescine aminotransferase